VLPDITSPNAPLGESIIKAGRAEVRPAGPGFDIALPPEEMTVAAPTCSHGKQGHVSENVGKCQAGSCQ
jgi:hypothetical protein